MGRSYVLFVNREKAGYENIMRKPVAVYITGIFLTIPYANVNHPPTPAFASPNPWGVQRLSCQREVVRSAYSVYSGRVMRNRMKLGGRLQNP